MDEADKLYHRLIRPIEKQMIGIIWRIIRDPDEVEDVFQEILAQIWARLEKIDRHPNPRAYILRICVTRSYDALRKRVRRHRFEVFVETVKEKLLPIRPRDFINEHDRKIALHQAIALLPPKQGQAVLLRAMEDMSYDLIGSILGCSAATARSHFSKGKDNLGKVLRAKDKQH